MTLTMDSLTQGEVFPDVKENAINAVKQAAIDDLDAAKARGFDPAIHKVGPDGKPVISKTSGGFSKIRGRKAGTKMRQDAAPQQSKLYNPNDPVNKPMIDSTGAATLVSNTIEIGTVNFISDEWKLGEFEKAHNILAWKNAFDYYGGVQLSPPMALVANHMQIIAQRAFAPKTATKWALFKAYMKDKMANYKFWGKRNAHIDNRSDPIGEDDIREKESMGIEKAGDQVDRTGSIS